MTSTICSLVLLVGLLGGLPAEIDQQDGAHLSNSAKFTGETETKTLTYEVAEGDDDVSVEIDARMHSGKIVCRLVDPTGKRRLSIQGTKGHLRGTTGRLDAIAGTWKIEIELAGASGSYHVTWRTK